MKCNITLHELITFNNCYKKKKNCMRTLKNEIYQFLVV